MAQWLTCVYVILHLVGNVVLTCILLRVASENYPGGAAISHLHKVVPPENNVHVYIDNLAAQTGVSRFTEINKNWIYNKTENIPHGSSEYLQFTYIIWEAKSKYSLTLKQFANSHSFLEVIEGFSHIHFNYNSFPPFKIRSKPMLFILKRKVPIDSEEIKELKEEDKETEKREVPESAFKYESKKKERLPKKIRSEKTNDTIVPEVILKTDLPDILLTENETEAINETLNLSDLPYDSATVPKESNKGNNNLDV